MSETLMDRDLNLSNFRIKNVGTAIEPTDAISKRDLDLARPKIFNYIESFISGANDPDPDADTIFRLAHPTDIYSALIIVEGVIMSPSAPSVIDSSLVVRDYQIITYAAYSEIQFTNPIQNGKNISVFYNTAIN